MIKGAYRQGPKMDAREWKQHPRSAGDEARMIQTIPHNNFAPLQFKFDLCKGFTNQRLQILDGVLAAMFLGAQVLMPKTIALDAQFPALSHPNEQNEQSLDYIFNMDRFEQRVQLMYIDFWCRLPKFRAFKIWCANKPPAAIVYTEDGAQIEDVKLDGWKPDHLISFGESVLEIFETKGKDEKPEQTIPVKFFRITESCEFYVKVKVAEGTEFWDWFWELHQSLEFNYWIGHLAENAKRQLLFSYGAKAERHALELGYKMDEHAARATHAGYHVVHLRASTAWQEHCEQWFSWIERKDNCMNNTWRIGNVLLSEGISPSLPVYLVTDLSDSNVQVLRKVPSMETFFSIYTVVTKEDMEQMLMKSSTLGSSLTDIDDIDSKLSKHQWTWTAVDFLLTEDADWFVGNSRDTFAAFVMHFRYFRQMDKQDKSKSLSYNGGETILEETILAEGQIRSPPMRPVIKWLFTAPPHTKVHDIVYNMTMVAVRSAMMKTDLVPICVTTGNPYSEFIVRLVSMGVRVIYHTPAWIDEAHEHVRRWNQIGARSGFQYIRQIQFQELVAQWLRIDLPILGILDEFVLYTDVANVALLFTNHVRWKDLVGDNFEALSRSMSRKALHGSFFNKYALFGEIGVPRFFAIINGSGVELDSSVMLMNLKNLRQSYNEFRAFALRKEQLLNLGGLERHDPCSYFSFYTWSVLPSHVAWVPRFGSREVQNDVSDVSGPSMVHFRGLECPCQETDKSETMRCEFCSQYAEYLAIENITDV
eukprot:symbB.v1.2.037781.t1/scaffold5674.1/size24704/2